jgi:type III secretion protein W
MSFVDSTRNLGPVPGSNGDWAQLANTSQPTRTLTDAAEEMSWAIAEEVEDRTLEERSLEEYEAPAIPGAEEIDALLHNMHDEAAAGDIRGFSSRLVQLARERNDVMLASSRWSGPGGRETGYRGEMKQYAALALALRDAEAKGESPRVVESLRDAVERCTREHGPQIRAGINTAEQAAMFGPSQKAADRFRATYHDAVLGQASFSATLQLVLERFGADLERGIDLLRRALGADMASLHPSREPERLHAVLQDLYQLATAASVLQKCHVIVQRLQRYLLLNQLQPLTLMQDLVGWTVEPWVMGYHVTLLLEKYCPVDDETAREHGNQDEDGDGQRGKSEESDEDDPETTKVVLLHGALSVIRDLPTKVFASDEHRLQAMEAIQQVLDAMLLPEE